METIRFPECANCGRTLYDLTVDHEDSGYICECNNLIFPSDYKMCEKGYKETVVWSKFSDN